MCTPIVQIPQNAVSSGKSGNDIGKPSVTLLTQLNLLPSPGDLEKSDGLGSALRGPTASVAVLEAGATAMSKWWAAGLGVAIAGAWGSVRLFWSSLDAQPETQQVLLWCAAIASAAAVLAVAYILGSDVRGRSAAMVATIDARRAVALAMIDATGRLNARTGPFLAWSSEGNEGSSESRNGSRTSAPRNGQTTH